MTTTLPAGWKLVPIEPTPKMVDATWNDPIDRDGGIESQNTRNRRIYAAMLAAAPTPPATTQDDTLARTGNTADHQEGWYAGVDHGRAEARASAQDDAREEDCDIPELRSHAEIGFEEWLTRQMPKGTVISNPAWWAPRILSAAMRSVRAQGHLVAAPAAGDARDAERLRRIAWLIGSIFVHGDFKAETGNERELEKLLRENGTFWDSLAQFDAAIAAQQGKGDGA